MASTTSGNPADSMSVMESLLREQIQDSPTADVDTMAVDDEEPFHQDFNDNTPTSTPEYQPNERSEQPVAKYQQKPSLINSTNPEDFIFLIPFKPFDLSLRALKKENLPPLQLEYQKACRIITAHWNLEWPSDFLPDYLRFRTPYSYSLLYKLRNLACNSKGERSKVVRLLQSARDARLSKLGKDLLSSTRRLGGQKLCLVRTRTGVWMPDTSREAVIVENVFGVMLQDVETTKTMLNDERNAERARRKAQIERFGHPRGRAVPPSLQLPLQMVQDTMAEHQQTDEQTDRVLRTFSMLGAEHRFNAARFGGRRLSRTMRRVGGNTSSSSSAHLSPSSSGISKLPRRHTVPLEERFKHMMGLNDREGRRASKLEKRMQRRMQGESTQTDPVPQAAQLPSERFDFNSLPALFAEPDSMGSIWDSAHDSTTPVTSGACSSSLPPLGSCSGNTPSSSPLPNPGLDSMSRIDPAYTSTSHQHSGDSFFSPLLSSGQNARGWMYPADESTTPLDPGSFASLSSRNGNASSSLPSQSSGQGSTDPLSSTYDYSLRRHNSLANYIRSLAPVDNSTRDDSSTTRYDTLASYIGSLGPAGNPTPASVSAEEEMEMEDLLDGLLEMKSQSRDDA